MITEAVNSVKKFMIQIGDKVHDRLSRAFSIDWYRDMTEENMRLVENALGLYSEFLRNTWNEHRLDPRELRIHLMLGELKEVVEALRTRDEVALLDGLADLMVVVIGTAITFDLPLAEALDEVMKSNLTKYEKYGFSPARYKGPDYMPPNLLRVLMEYRTKSQLGEPDARLEEETK